MEARGLAARDSNGFSDPFVRLQLGTTRARTSVVYRNLNPSWNEEFVFNVVDLDEELSIMVWDEDRFTDDFLGQVRISVSSVLSAEKLTVYRSWFPLRKRNEKSKHPVTGMLLHSHFKPNSSCECGRCNGQCLRMGFKCTLSSDYSTIV
jgi:hypothetical protein